MRAALAILVLLFAAAASAAVHRVPGEYATLQAGIDAGAEGDTVLVAPGTYTGAGNRDLNFNGTNLVLASEAGAEVTIIDCEYESRAITFDHGESRASHVSGLSLRQGVDYNGGGIDCTGASPTLRRLIIEDCGASSYYGGQGGGICLWSGSDALVEDVILRNNYAGHSMAWFGSGAGLASYDSSPEIRRVRFEGNITSAGDAGGECCPTAWGGGILLRHGSPILEEVVFFGNEVTKGSWNTRSRGGAIYAECELVVRNATLVGNGADGGAGSAVYCLNGSVALERSIVAANGLDEMYPNAPVAGPTTAECTLVHGNAGGNWVGGLAGQGGLAGNLAINPMFCDAWGGDLRLGPESPCLPAGNSCGVLIGAFGAGCEETPVALASFTATPTAGAVDLAWEADALVDFRLAGTRAGASWDIAWQAAGAGLYRARDVNPQLAPGGEVSYSLEGRLLGEDWQLLRTLAVTLPPAFATRLLAPHPNPFNPVVTLPFTLAAPGRVRLEIFDLAGRQVAMLADGHFEAGEQALAWDGRDAAGKPQASGVYFARFVATGFTETKRLVLLR